MLTNFLPRMYNTNIKLTQTVSIIFAIVIEHGTNAYYIKKRVKLWATSVSPIK